MRTLIMLTTIAVAAAMAGGLFIYSGTYNVAATAQHTAPIYWLLEDTMRRSVRQHAREIKVPKLDDPVSVERGLSLYRQHCVQCHGAPGVAPDAYALGLSPLPANLAHTAREWPPAELYWVVKHGIKMSGMPAWEFRLPEDDLWAVVAFLQVLPKLSPQQYHAMRPAGPEDGSQRLRSSETAISPDVNRGRMALHQYACATCHEIPGIVGANVPVGPPLARIATRGIIAGMLPNTPENMIRWLRAPQAVNPRTAMPDLGIPEHDARNIAAYLATLK